MRVVRVALGERSYSILISQGLLSRLGEHCRRTGLGKRCAIISDVCVAPHFVKAVMRSLQRGGFDPITLIIPAGEKAKSLKTVQHCYDQLARHRLERASFVIALGGGVVGDLAGFVAATYLRGIDFVQVPTTLLAQVDSSVGGKVGVNLSAGKNLVGSFHQPRLVLCDLDTLKTLPEREFRSGLAEVIKYGVIADGGLFRKLESEMPRLLRRNQSTLETIIARCCEIKAEVVADDEREGGRRAVLNFGHTIGHALEATSGYGKFLHGEAIAIGQTAAALLSAQTGLSADDAGRIEALLQRAGLPTRLRLSAAVRRRLVEAMTLDKKVTAGEGRFVLARKIGDVVWGQKVSQAGIIAAFSALNEVALKNSAVRLGAEE